MNILSRHTTVSRQETNPCNYLEKPNATCLVLQWSSRKKSEWLSLPGGGPTAVPLPVCVPTPAPFLWGSAQAKLFALWQLSCWDRQVRFLLTPAALKTLFGGISTLNEKKQVVNQVFLWSHQKCARNNSDLVPFLYCMFERAWCLPWTPSPYTQGASGTSSLPPYFEHT